MPATEMSASRIGRRAFISSLGAVAASATLMTPARAHAAAAYSHRLRMVNPHNNEHFDEWVVRNGKFQRAALDKFKRFARDWRAGISNDIDPRVLRTAVELQRAVGNDEPMLLISGYRSPQTNRALNGTAKNSLHMRGLALDLRQPGVSTSTLHRAAVSLRQGGVGKYSSSDFVHVDCGRVRYWGS